ncbi:MAG: hypothetical protein K0R94_622 [Burkholderiales bacterium]|jgi:DNA-binding CsgD family transcriptional regulator|nr:hypothetical protein [Burkholderiales bacterium]
MELLNSYKDIDFENHIFFNLVEEINQVIDPLSNYFGLNSFNYHKTFNDGSHIRLTNIPNWYRHYLKHRLYLQSVFELPACNYYKNRIIWSNIDTHNIILQETRKFNINYGITLVEPCPDGCEFFFLGTTTNDKNVINKYLSNLYLLDKFLANFHNSAAVLFDKVNPFRLKVRDWQENQLKFNPVNNIDKISFLASIYSYDFTKRELDCIPLLLRGYTAKQIGEYLNISFRTVEDYINQLKFKTKTINRNELLNLLAIKFG